MASWILSTEIKRNLGNSSPREPLFRKRHREGTSSLPVSKELLDSLELEA